MVMPVCARLLFRPSKITSKCKWIWRFIRECCVRIKHNSDISQLHSHVTRKTGKDVSGLWCWRMRWSVNHLQPRGFSWEHEHGGTWREAGNIFTFCCFQAHSAREREATVVNSNRCASEGETEALFTLSGRGSCQSGCGLKAPFTSAFHNVKERKEEKRPNVSWLWRTVAGLSSVPTGNKQRK